MVVRRVDSMGKGVYAVMIRPAPLGMSRKTGDRSASAGLRLILLFTLIMAGHAGPARAFDYGQTGGGPITGQLTVTVVDGADGTPLEDAWVMVGPMPGNPIADNYAQTGPDGRVMFLDPDLSGAQTVTAAMDGYRHFTVVAVNASEITIPMESFNAYNPASPPDDGTDWVVGDMTNFNQANNYVIDCNEYLEVGVVRDLLNLEWLMDFDIMRLFGPAIVETFTNPPGNFDLPRNLYIPSQRDGTGPRIFSAPWASCTKTSNERRTG